MHKVVRRARRARTILPDPDRVARPARRDAVAGAVEAERVVARQIRRDQVSRRIDAAVGGETDRPRGLKQDDILIRVRSAGAVAADLHVVARGRDCDAHPKAAGEQQILGVERHRVVRPARLDARTLHLINRAVREACHEIERGACNIEAVLADPERIAGAARRHRIAGAIDAERIVAGHGQHDEVGGHVDAGVGEFVKRPRHTLEQHDIVVGVARGDSVAADSDDAARAGDLDGKRRSIRGDACCPTLPGSYRRRR